MITAISVLIFLILLTFSIVVHEYAHVLAEGRYGSDAGEIILLPFSGVSVKQGKKDNIMDEFKIALAGPAASTIFALALSPLIFFGYGFEAVLKTTILEFSPIIDLFKINIALAVFNIIPVFPMDGGRMLRTYLTDKFDFVKATKLTAWITYIILALVILLGLFFNLLVVVLAFFIYGAAHSKKRFDLAAAALGAVETGDETAVRRTDDSITELGIHWIAQKPVLKSIAFMLLASISFSLVWLLSPALSTAFSLLFLLCYTLGSYIIFYHTRSKVLFRYSVLACVLWLVYITSNFLEMFLSLSFYSFLLFEAVRASLVPVVGSLFFFSILQNNILLKKAQIYLPLPLFLIVSALFFVGTVVFYYECYLLSPFESDIDTIRFVLRYDIAYLLWFIASALMFVSMIFLVYVGSLSKYGRITTVKFITGTFILFLLVSFLSRDLVLITAARYSAEPDELDMKVGLNAGNITKLEFDKFDRAVHLEVSWQKVYRNGPDRADWADSDWQLDYAGKNNIDVFLQIHPLAPRWFYEKHENAIMRDQWDHKFMWVDREPDSNKSRIWDLSFTDPEVLEAKINFTEEAVRRYENLSCVKFIGIQNEPAYPTDFNNLRLASYDNSTVTAFENWTAALFDYDIEAFRNETSVLINDWSELSPPKSSVHPLWDRWLTFREESLIWLVENLTAAVSRNTEKPVTVKIMAHFLARYSTVQSGLSARVVSRFFQLSDVVSLDLYPLTSADLRHSLEYYQKLAGGKSIIVPEFNMALGSNMPGGGAVLYYNLIVLNDYADYVFIFSGGNHYLYGMKVYDHTPMPLGLRLYRVHRNDGDVYGLYDDLLAQNFRAIPNYYHVYVLNSQIFGLPVIPWPVLFLLIIPIPIADEKRRIRVRNFNYLLILILLIAFGLMANI